MGYLVSSRWITEAASGLPRADRQSCEYQAYVPDLLADIVRPLREAGFQDRSIMSLGGEAASNPLSEALGKS